MIGLFNECFPPVMDGVSMTVSNLAANFQAQGYDVCVVTPDESGLHPSDYPFTVLPYFSVPVPMRHPYRCGLPFFDPLYQRQVSKIPFDIVHAHCPFSSGKEALRIARRLNVPMVATFHSKYRDDFARIIQNQTLLDHIIHQIVQFYESADEVWIPQESVGETLRSYGYHGPMTVVDNGSEYAGKELNNDVRLKTRRQLLPGDNEPLLLFVGQHIWEKNLKLILQVLSRLKELPWHMVFVGDGYAREAMIQMAARLGLTSDDNNDKNRVSFLGCIHDRDLLSNIYSAADLMLFPSLYDNAPLVVREAAAMHTPSLVTRHSNTAEVIFDGYNGFMAENNVESYADCLRMLLRRPSLIRHAGDMASRTLVRSWGDIAEEITDRYMHLIARKQRKVV